jgi:hypothetical protein
MGNHSRNPEPFRSRHTTTREGTSMHPQQPPAQQPPSGPYQPRQGYYPQPPPEVLATPSQGADRSTCRRRPDRRYRGRVGYRQR